MGSLFLAPAEVPSTTGRAAAAEACSPLALHPVPTMAPAPEPWEVVEAAARTIAGGSPTRADRCPGAHVAGEGTADRRPIDRGWDDALVDLLDDAQACPPWQVLVEEAADQDRGGANSPGRRCGDEPPRDPALAAEAPVPWAQFAEVGERWALTRPAWTEAGWWEATLRDDVRALLWLPAGPALAATLVTLASGPNGTCLLAHTADRMLRQPIPGQAPGWPCACQVVTAAAWQACAAWAEAQLMAAVTNAAGPTTVEYAVGGDRGHVIVDPAREELAAALRWSPAAMANRIATARAVSAHPSLLALVASGAVSGWAARLVVDQVLDLSDEDAARVVADTVARVHARLASGRRGWTSAEVGRAARAARLKACPQTVQEARIRAFSHRRVQVHPGPDGMATLVAQLADVDAHRIHRRLTAIAAGLQADAAADGSPEPRSRDQLRADTLVDLVLGRDGANAMGQSDGCGAAGGAAAQDGLAPGIRRGSPAPPGDTTRTPADDASGPGSSGADLGGSFAQGPGSGTRPEIMVIVSLEVLLGLSEDPAELPGLGPIAADVARDLAADGTWRAWITDAAGVVTATGTRGYVPSAAVARAVRAREPHCRFPGCRQPAQRCDLDHAIPWPRGRTSPDNLGPLCRRHHQLKTHAAWALDPSPPPPGRSRAGQGATAGAPPGAPAQGAHAWRWRTPAGFAIHDAPTPHLRH